MLGTLHLARKHFTKISVSDHYNVVGPPPPFLEIGLFTYSGCPRTHCVAWAGLSFSNAVIIDVSHYSWLRYIVVQWGLVIDFPLRDRQVFYLSTTSLAYSIV